MRPIHIQVSGWTGQGPREICAQLLDLSRWSEFKGSSFLPGIRSAAFETGAPHGVGTRIRVQNTDGSTHVEQIIEWDVERRVRLQFQEFQPPLSRLATHFIETWEFQCGDGGTRITRSMDLHARNFAGFLLLLPISQLMKKAFTSPS